MTKPQAILSSDTVKLIHAGVASFLQPYFYLKCISLQSCYRQIRFVMVTSLFSDWPVRTHVKWVVKTSHFFFFLEEEALVGTGKWWSLFTLVFSPNSVCCGTCPLGKNRDFLTFGIVYCACKAENTLKCVSVDHLTDKNDPTRGVKT